MVEHLLPGNFDPPDFALQLARKDVDLAVGALVWFGMFTMIGPMPGWL